MKNYENSSNISGMIYIFNNDYVIGKNGNDSQIYYNSLSIAFRNQFSYSQWLDMVSGDYSSDFLIEKNFNGDSDVQCIVYADSLQWGIYGKANIFVNIPVTNIEQLTKSLDPGTTLILCIGDKVRLAVDSEGVKELADNLIEEEVLDEKKYMIVHQQSSQKKIKYYMMVPHRNYWKEFRYVQNLFYISLVLTLIIGVFSVYLLVKRNYRPLADLYTRVTDGTEKGNEFKQIENAHNMLAHENGMMHKQIMMRASVMQSYYLMSLMRGWTVWAGNENTPVNLLPGENLILIGMILPMMEEKESVQDELMLFVVDNVFAELMESEEFYRLEEEKYLFYLIRTDEGNACKHKCLEKLNFLQTFMEEKWRGAITAVVSKTENDINQLRCLYQEVTAVLESASVLGMSGVIDAETWMRNKGIVKECIEYIELHYTECSLNINSVADGIGRNAKYVSKIFKEETGKSILEYIHLLRIRKAQSLIQFGKSSLEEVYEQVGYANDVTFRRAFVNVTGMMPSEYKNALECKNTSD